VLHQIRVFNRKSFKAKQIDGDRWSLYPLRMLEASLPFMGQMTLRRAITKLEREGILKSRSDLSRGRKNRTKWYTIDAEKLRLCCDQNDQNTTPKVIRTKGGCSDQNDQNYIDKYLKHDIKIDTVGYAEKSGTDNTGASGEKENMGKKEIEEIAAKVLERHSAKPLVVKPRALHALWLHQCALNYPDMQTMKPTLAKELGQWSKMIQQHLGARKDVKAFITKVVGHWPYVSTDVGAKSGLSTTPTRPHIGFLYAHLTDFIVWFDNSVGGATSVQSVSTAVQLSSPQSKGVSVMDVLAELEKANVSDGNEK